MTNTINSCGIFVKKLKLKQDVLKTWMRGDLTALVWKDKRDVNMLINMH